MTTNDPGPEFSVMVVLTARERAKAQRLSEAVRRGPLVNLMTLFVLFAFIVALAAGCYSLWLARNWSIHMSSVEANRRTIMDMLPQSTLKDLFEVLTVYQGQPMSSFVQQLTLGTWAALTASCAAIAAPLLMRFRGGLDARTTRYRITESTLEITRGDSRMSIAWLDVVDVRTTPIPKILLVYLRWNTVETIPAAAFASADLADLFAAKVRERMLAARTTTLSYQTPLNAGSA